MPDSLPSGENGPIQWAPDGPMSGVPSEVVRLLADDDGKTYGYGYGPGWSVIFGSKQGEVALLPGQWVTRRADGRIEVTDERPDSAITPEAHDHEKCCRYLCCAHPKCCGYRGEPVNPPATSGGSDDA